VNVKLSAAYTLSAAGKELRCRSVRASGTISKLVAPVVMVVLDRVVLLAILLVLLVAPVLKALISSASSSASSGPFGT
jgi:hypothetical protein